MQSCANLTEKVWEKAAGGKNPKPGEIQHPVRGSGGGQGQRIDFTSEQAARGSAARALNMNGGTRLPSSFLQGEIFFKSWSHLCFKRWSSSRPENWTSSLAKKWISREKEVDITSSGDSPHREICFFTMAVVSGVLADRAAANLMRPERD